MPVDSSIALSVRPIQLDNPMDVQSKAMTLRQLAGNQQLQDMQIAEHQRGIQQERTLSDLYRGNIAPDGKVNRTGVITGAAQQGLGSKIPSIQKQFLDTDKTEADLAHVRSQTGEIDWKTIKEQLDYTGAALSSMLSDPNVNHEKVISRISNLVQQGVLSQQKGADMVRSLPGPEGLRNFLLNKGMEVMDSAKRVELMLPKTDVKDTGSSFVPVQTNQISGKVTAGKPVLGKTVTPGEVLSSQTARRGQDMSRESEMMGVEYQTDPESGNVTALPKKAAPGQLIRGSAVLAPGSGMQPLQGKSSATEDQGKAGGWLAQANNAWSNMQKAMQSDSGAASPGVGDAVSGIPFMGAAGRSMMGANRQKFNQASSSLSEALLRAATGAGINKDEAAQKVAELTPQFGDGEDVVAQKMASIPIYLKSLEVRAGPVARKVPGGGGQPAGAAMPQGSLGTGTMDFQLPPDVLAILAKHGGK